METRAIVVTNSHVRFLKDFVRKCDENYILKCTDETRGDTIYCNYTQLKYFGIIVDASPEGKKRTGMWRLTRHGYDFIKGETSIPKTVHVFNDQVIEVDEGDVKIGEIDEAPWDWQRVVDNMRPYNKEIQSRLF
jgi:hypothetical protein